ncbi:MAG: alpha-N-acetylglucosaminidase C-terminal domain-containing protein [Bacteroidota bacterium]
MRRFMITLMVLAFYVAAVAQPELPVEQWKGKTILLIADHPLNDYANRAWAGLMDTYYSTRWEMFIDRVTWSVEQGEPFNEEAFGQI